MALRFSDGAVDARSTRSLRRGASGRIVCWGMAHCQVMGVAVHHIVIDAHDLPALARFWSQVLDWRILSER